MVFAALASGSTTLDELLAQSDVAVHGERAVLEELLGLLDVFEFGFEIVLPVTGLAALMAGAIGRRSRCPTSAHRWIHLEKILSLLKAV